MMSTRPKPKISHYRGTSTLLNETKNIQLYRVSDETKKKVSDETQRIQEDMRLHNLRSRRRFRREENDRLRRNEDSRLAMEERWRHKTKTNPLGVDLVKEEENRVLRVTERNRVKALQQQKLDLMASMDGGSVDFEHGFKTVLDKLGKEDMRFLLAMRKSDLNDQVIKEEQQRIDGMLASELKAITTQFPTAVPYGLKAVAEARESKYNKIEFSDKSRLRASGKHVLAERTKSGNHLMLALEGLNRPGIDRPGSGASGSLSRGTSRSRLSSSQTRRSQSPKGSLSMDPSELDVDGDKPDRFSPYFSNPINISDRDDPHQFSPPGNRHDDEEEDNDWLAQYQRKLDEESTSLDNSTYKAPTKRLQQFEEDLDKEFSML